MLFFFQQLHGNFSWAPSRNQRLRPSGGAVPIPGSHPWGFLTDHGEWLSERANLVTLLYNSKKKWFIKKNGVYMKLIWLLYMMLYTNIRILFMDFFSANSFPFRGLTLKKNIPTAPTICVICSSVTQPGAPNLGSSAHPSPSAVWKSVIPIFVYLFSYGK